MNVGNTANANIVNFRHSLRTDSTNLKETGEIIPMVGRDIFPEILAQEANDSAPQANQLQTRIQDVIAQPTLLEDNAQLYELLSKADTKLDKLLDGLGQGNRGVRYIKEIILMSRYNDICDIIRDAQNLISPGLSLNSEQNLDAAYNKLKDIWNGLFPFIESQKFQDCLSVHPIWPWALAGLEVAAEYITYVGIVLGAVFVAYKNEIGETPALLSTIIVTAVAVSIKRSISIYHTHLAYLTKHAKIVKETVFSPSLIKVLEERINDMSTAKIKRHFNTQVEQLKAEIKAGQAKTTVDVLEGVAAMLANRA